MKSLLYSSFIHSLDQRWVPSDNHVLQLDVFITSFTTAKIVCKGRRCSFLDAPSVDLKMLFWICVFYTLNRKSWFGVWLSRNNMWCFSGARRGLVLVKSFVASVIHNAVIAITVILQRIFRFGRWHLLTWQSSPPSVHVDGNVFCNQILLVTAACLKLFVTSKSHEIHIEHHSLCI